jgi:two-component system OmpR family response regulator
VTWISHNPSWSNVARVMNLFDVIIWSQPSSGDGALGSLRTLTHANAAPVIVLAEEADEAQKVALLEAGVAYCLPNNVAPRELSARIGALSARRQASAVAPHIMCVGGWMIDISGKRLIGPDLQIAALTPVEFDLLRLFIESRERVLTRPFLLDRLGKSGPGANDRTVDVYVSRLRHKLQTLGAGEAIRLRAVWNEGYVCATASRPTPLRPS